MWVPVCYYARVSKNTIIMMEIKEISAIAGHKTDVVQTGSIYLRNARNLLK